MNDYLKRVLDEPSRNELEKLEGEVRMVCTRIKEITNSVPPCPHDNYKLEYETNSGGYDPMSDMYWVNFTCLDCGKWESIDSSDPRYRTLGIKQKEKNR
jgi:hypothetical protein